MPKSFIFNQLHLGLDFKSSNPPSPKTEATVWCCAAAIPQHHHQRGEQTVAVTRRCPQVSLCFTRCRPLADAQWMWTTDVPLQSWSVLAPGSDHFTLWCLQSGCPVVSSQEVERGWHGMDVTLPRINHNLITVRLWAIDTWLHVA